jgi:hypothetical protein
MMNRATRTWTILLGAAVLAAALTACGNTSDEPKGEAPSPSSSPSASASPAAEPGSPAPGPSESAAADLPASKELSLILEGNPEKKTAKLATGEGFAFYRFDIFSFDPKLGLLTMNVDDNYYARIEQLPEGYKLKDVRQAAVDKLSKVGEVREYKDGELDPALGGAALLLSAHNDKLTQEVIVKEVGSSAYRIEVNMPVGEPSEGFAPHLFAMLGTLAER